jgi:hypothetical protein
VRFGDDDVCALLDRRAHDGCEANRTGAEDEERRPGFARHRAHHGAGAGLDATAQRAENLDGQARLDLDHVALGR